MLHTSHPTPQNLNVNIIDGKVQNAFILIAIMSLIVGQTVNGQPSRLCKLSLSKRFRQLLEEEDVTTRTFMNKVRRNFSHRNSK